MELVIVPKPKLTTILSESGRLIKSHHRRFSTLFLALFFISLIPLALSKISSFFTANNGNDPTRLIWISLSNLAIKIFSLLVTISITSVALHSFNEEPDVGLSSVAESIRRSFFPIVATNLLQLAIRFLVILGFTVIFGFQTLSAYFLLGLKMDPKSPLFLFLAIIAVGVPSLLVMTYLNLVSWGLVNVVVVAESTWGFTALKRSKNLVNGKEFLALIIYLVFAVSYNIIDRIGKPFNTMIGDLEENKSFVAVAFLVVAQLVASSSLSSMVSLYETVATTLFYVFCKGAHHEEGFYYGDSDDQYVKCSKHGGYAQV